ncbi:MAG: hypothetical protein OXG44_14605 [Gammaproteobacteria bacterium]|nr:hypothetical protein [Gammaproteobacteria bacterium]
MTAWRPSRSNAVPAGFVQRAKIELHLAEGVSARAVEAKLDVSLDGPSPSGGAGFWSTAWRA